MDYSRYRNLATDKIAKYGTNGVVKNTRTVPDPDKPWLNTTVTTETNVKLIAFPDDGRTFVDHNITGNVRILMIAPVAGLSIAIGDTITYGAQTVTVQRLKDMDPDGSGAILWAVLVL